MTRKKDRNNFLKLIIYVLDQINPELAEKVRKASNIYNLIIFVIIAIFIINIIMKSLSQG